MSRNRRARSPLHLFRLALLVTGLGSLHPSGVLAVDHYDRAQLHRNAARGVEYLPLGRRGASVKEGSITIRVARKINLHGDPSVNVFSNVLPIDADGDGQFELLQYNGFRMMRLWSVGGNKRWEVSHPGGRVHDPRAGTHRDTVAVIDVDGDGREDVAHCWVIGGKRHLVFRRGINGKMIRSVRLPNDVKSECHVAAFRTVAHRQPILLVPDQIRDRSCKRDFVGYWARTLAFDLEGRRLWQRDTCDAGHHAYPLDENQDGRAEAIFVGRYLLNPNGRVRCTLAGWPRGDHADAVVPADIDRKRKGFEAVAVGRTGVGLYDANNCQRIWRVSGRTIRSPQHVALARLDRGASTPQIVVEESGTMRRPRTFLLDAAGKILAVQRPESNTMPVQNANLDNARGSDELVGSWGEVFGAGLRKRAGTGWYWRLKGSRVKETKRIPYAGSYGKWQAFPLVVDLDRDGRDEIVQWGQSLIVIGKAK